MIQVFLRILVWLAVFGIGYLLLGPQLFDSSRDANPFSTDAELFLPPARSAREIEYERLAQQRALTAEEQAAYLALARERQAAFWKGRDLTVSQALEGVTTGRRERLAELLAERGLTHDEAAVFMMVLDRDHPELLADRE